MKKIVQGLKFISFLSLMVIYIVHSFILSMIYRDIWIFRSKIIYVMSWYSSLALRLAGVRVKKYGMTNDMKFLVSNHLSYLDILILCSQFPSTFVTSVEIREIPVLGLITKLGGCLYVERRNKSNLSNEIKELTTALQKNIPVAIFPEATSTNAESVLRFKKPLFQASLDSHVPVSPVCINYLKIDGKLFDTGNRDFVCWYGDMDFLAHLWELMGKRNVLVELRLLNEIQAAEPILLAEESHRRIQQNFIGLNPTVTTAH
ncbi:MAG: 1-acyl-sn-glycerol-3-phosphate acyltransferase [Bdellovibrionota bacterium]